MENLRINCTVCGKPEAMFSYGVHCCNACKMFFRRAIVVTDFPTECKYKVACPGCRFCRFQKCLAAGMRKVAAVHPPVLPATLELKETSLSAVIANLKHVDNYRQNKFLKFTTLQNFGVDELILTNSMAYVEKPPGFEQDVYIWAAVKHATSIGFMKKFEFVKDLFVEDLKIFIKATYKSFMIFCTAMRCYSSRREVAEFPGGLDTLPRELTKYFDNCRGVLDGVRCPIIAKLRELKVTQDELLLISAVFICNPLSPDLSDHAQELISKYQKKYADFLFEYCLKKYGKIGPSRFTDLLSIFPIINNTTKNLDNVIIAVYGRFRPERQVQKVFDDMMETVLD